ncbi:hypothetical protein, partial [Streptomyces sp. NPDC002172]
QPPPTSKITTPARVLAKVPVTAIRLISVSAPVVRHGGSQSVNTERQRSQDGHGRHDVYHKRPSRLPVARTYVQQQSGKQPHEHTRNRENEQSERRHKVTVPNHVLGHARRVPAFPTAIA